MQHSRFPTIMDSRPKRFADDAISEESFRRTKLINLMEINEKLDTLGDLMPLLSGSDVRPIECDTSLAALNEFLDVIRRSYSALEDLPMQLSKKSNKYSFSIALGYLESEALDLHSLVQTLRPICRTDGERKGEIQAEIQELLGRILENSRQLNYRLSE